MTATAQTTAPAAASSRWLDPNAAAEALFAVSLRSKRIPTGLAAIVAIKSEIATIGVDGCAGLVAAEYGEHPELAAPRMQRVLAVVATLDLN